MLFKLSFKNMRKNVKDYAIYFFTLVLGVAIFYVFNSMESQEAVLRLSEDKRKIMQLMMTLLNGISIFVSCILGFLIIYASRFLIKRRKKEFGIYMTLGMGKRKISTILLLETFLIGLISLAIGLCLGIFASQIMSVFVAKMFEVDMTSYQFIFSSAAMLKTIFYFGIIYLLVMIFNTISVSKCKLIDLINASKKNEKVKIKNTSLSVFIFLIAACLLGYAYYGVTVKAMNLTVQQLGIYCIMGVVGTYLVFWSLSGFILKIIGASKKIYLKNLNTFILRQIHSGINTTVFSMTIICLMLFLTITVLSTAVSMNNTLRNDLKQNTPVDVNISMKIDPNNSNIRSLKDTLIEKGINVNDRLKDPFEVNLYETNLTVKDTVITGNESIVNEYPMMKSDVKELIMKLSDYNKIAKRYGHKTYTLNSNEYIVLADFDNMVTLRNKNLKKQIKIKMNEYTLKPKYNEVKEGFINISNSQVNTGIIIVADNIVKSNQRVEELLVADYNATDENQENIIDKELNTILNPYQDSITLMSRVEIYASGIGLGAIVTFVGIYLGIIFLISGAAMLALKELSESSDNKERYKVLRKIGADEKMINQALFTQIGVFFLLPLILASIHSVFGIQLANKMLLTLVNKSLITSIIVVAIIIGIIYGGYFLITYLCSKKIIQDNE